MSDTVHTNWTELSQQVADLQVKAFLRLIFEIGEVLETHGQYPIRNSSPMPSCQTSVDNESTGAAEKLVTSVTDSSPTDELSSRERKRNPSGLGECLGQNRRGDRRYDEEHTRVRTAHVAALAKTKETSTTRDESRKAYRNP